MRQNSLSTILELPFKFLLSKMSPQDDVYEWCIVLQKTIMNSKLDIAQNNSKSD